MERLLAFVGAVGMYFTSMYRALQQANSGLIIYPFRTKFWIYGKKSLNSLPKRNLCNWLFRLVMTIHSYQLFIIPLLMVSKWLCFFLPRMCEEKAFKVVSSMRLKQDFCSWFLFVVAEIFQKFIFSLNVNLSLNLKNLIGVDLYQERIKLN